ncbi:MAG: CTP synthase [Endomicrobiaceae bacterium]|nr:CTP synthase [Endomicrobiaceae bacterium]MDD3922803.1 CTP synthase [Endomicrobiaceae bacterium]MDD5101551.1 CTP synthase [Endomicrobiaceae bacterium]
MKYIFMTGGVVSSLGKGITGASIGKLLQLHGYKVNMIKMDPYINVDPGTMNPFQHGEVYVTADGAEADLDLGTYERFLDMVTTKENTNTAGHVYQTVINKERRGDYNGGTVQVIPHITDEIKRRFSVFEKKVDITIVEIGGTIGDIEGLPFIEATRQFILAQKREDVMSVHLTLIPYISGANELKTKPTQHSVNKLREIGIVPDMIVCRTQYPITKSMISKISLFCNVAPEAVVEARTCSSIYHIPESLHKQGVDDFIMKRLGLKSKIKFDSKWLKYVKRENKSKEVINIGVIGKYADLKDAYKSIDESIKISAMDINVNVNVHYISSEDKNLLKTIKNMHGILVPGGFGIRGIEGKISAIKYARENKVPFFGICLGMQCCVIEAARNLLGLKDANSTEISKKTSNPVIEMLEEQKDVKYLGGTMRLGNYEAKLIKGSFAQKLYKSDTIVERHRHRYEMNPKYIDMFKKVGFDVSGYHKGVLPEIVEIKNHPFFVGVQFHPEFGARPMKTHPVFQGFIQACKKRIK